MHRTVMIINHFQAKSPKIQKKRIIIVALKLIFAQMKNNKGIDEKTKFFSEKKPKFGKINIKKLRKN